MAGLPIHLEACRLIRRFHGQLWARNARGWLELRRRCGYTKVFNRNRWTLLCHGSSAKGLNYCSRNVCRGHMSMVCEIASVDATISLIWNCLYYIVTGLGSKRSNEAFACRLALDGLLKNWSWVNYAVEMVQNDPIFEILSYLPDA
jgi:hypothetical protein